MQKENIHQFFEWLDKAKTTGAFVMIDKDYKWTSFDVVSKLRKITKIQKIGHSGTLDPLATGLLLIGLGKATKELSQFKNFNKTYYAIIKVGATTKSDDCEYEEENHKDITNLNSNVVIEVIHSFIGKILQVPPKFSAKQVEGKRLYKLARQNKNFQIDPIETIINSIIIQQIRLPYIEIIVDCSTGTYIRSLARDIGNTLGVGGYLFKLRRLKIGEYNVENALKIEDFSEYYAKI